MQLLPAANILTGTELQIKAQMPQAMDDFSTDSGVELFDPRAGPLSHSFPMDGAWRAFSIGTDGNTVAATATLIDQSRHSKIETVDLEKIAYLQGTAQNYYLNTDSGYQIEHMTTVPGDVQGLYWAENNRQDGYRIRGATGVITDQPNGQIQFLEYSGSALVAQVRRDGEDWLHFWPLTGGAFAQPVERRILGDVVAGNGDYLFIRHGQMLSALYYRNGHLIPVAGVSLPNPLFAVVQDAQRLAVLTADGVDFIALEEGALPKLAITGSLALTGGTGISIEANRLLIWTVEGQVEQHRLQWDNGQLAAVKDASYEVMGQITQVVWDGELAWLHVVGDEHDPHWQVWRNGERLGSLSGDREDIRFAAGELISLYNSADESRIDKQQITVTNAATAPAVTLHHLPFGVLITLEGGDASLGLQDVHFKDAQGQLIPAQLLRYRGELDSYLGATLNHGDAWFIQADVLSSDLTLHMHDHAANNFSITLQPVLLQNGVASLFWPLDGASLATESNVPVRTGFAVHDYPKATKLTVNGNVLEPLLGLAGNAYHWLTVPTADNMLYQLNYAAQQHLFDVTIAPNSQHAAVILQGVANNQLIAEGEPVELGYQIDIEPGHTFNYAEVLLEDFNGNLILSIPLSEPVGLFTLRLPAVEVQDNFTLRLRAYLDDNYQFSETGVGIRVAPRHSMPEPKLMGLSSLIYAGSELNLSLLVEDVTQYQASIQVFDGQGNLLLAGNNQLNAVLPEGINTIEVVAELSDGYGNSRQTRRSVPITDGFSVGMTSGQHSFDAFLPDVGGYWYSQGRKLYNQQGQVFEADAKITAIEYIERYLLIAVEGIGLQLLDLEDNFNVISTQPTAAKVTAVVSNDSGVLVAFGSKVELFRTQGPALRSVRQIQLPQTVLDIHSFAQGYVILSSGKLIHLNEQGNTQAQRDGEGFTAMVVQGEKIYLAKSNGALLVLNNNLQGASFEIAVNAEKIIGLNGKLLALNGSQGQVQLIDVAALNAIQKVAQWPLDIGSEVNKARLASGQIWLGGSAGNVIRLGAGGNTFVQRYDSQTSGDGIRGTIVDLALHQGRLISAASNFGAGILTQQPEAGWDNSSYPAQAYTQTVFKVAAAGGYLFMLQPQQQRVMALNNSNLQPTVVFDQLEVTGLMVIGDEIAASAGGTLHLAKMGNFNTRRTIHVSDEMIVELASSGGLAVVTTDVGHLLLVDTSPDRVDSERVTDLTGFVGLSMSHPTLNSDYLFICNGAQLHRFNLHDYSMDQVTVPGPVVLASMQQGRLWVVVDENGGFQLMAIDPYDLQPIDGINLALADQPTAIAVEHDRIAIGAGSNNLQILQLPRQVLSAVRALTSPVTGTLYQAGDKLITEMPSQGVAAVSYFINNRRVATATRTGFNHRIPVPADLPNGQSFTLRTEVESESGAVMQSLERKLYLQSEQGVALSNMK